MVRKSDQGLLGDGTDPYDAFLLVSFGGPEGMDDVMPFLENVLRGKNVPRERMLSVAHHYEQFGGVSPINEHNRRLIEALKPLLTDSGPRLPIYWGNRNWHPMLKETIERMANDGVKRALAFVTSAYSSYSGCKQYLEDIELARAQVGPRAPVIEKLRAFFNHPGFVEANAVNLTRALSAYPAERRELIPIAFTAHSIPSSMAAGCAYQSQLEDAARLIAGAAQHPSAWRVVYQSRSGPASQTWLEPDICDYIRELHQSQSLKELVIAPIGFISDHMEVIYDLDQEAGALCDQLNIRMVRGATVGVEPRFIKMIAELVDERLTSAAERRVLGDFAAAPDTCPLDCCPSGMSRSRPIAAEQVE